MDKLELKHIAPYLPYGLNVMVYEGGRKYRGVLASATYKDVINRPYYVRFNELGGPDSIEGSNIHRDRIKPILRPLSDYYDINSPAMNDLNLDLGDQIWLVNLADGTYHVDELPYRLACTLAEEHIDFMGLIPAGLAISYKEAGL